MARRRIKSRWIKGPTPGGYGAYVTIRDVSVKEARRQIGTLGKVERMDEGGVVVRYTGNNYKRLKPLVEKLKAFGDKVDFHSLRG